MLQVAPSMSERDRVLYAAASFKEDAADWWANLLMDSPDKLPCATWQTLKDAMIEEYVDDDQNFDARAELRGVQQWGSVRKYTSAWRKKSRRVRGATVDELVSIYLDGLKPHIRKDVRSDVNFLAKDFTSSTSMGDLRFVQRLAKALDGGHDRSAKPPPSPRWQAKPKPETKVMFNFAMKLDSALTKERYDKGLCFVCGESGHKARQCPQRATFKPQKLNFAAFAGQCHDGNSTDEDSDAPLTKRARSSDEDEL